MQTIRSLPELRAARAELVGSVALVPTMGALHAGHMALIAEARARADHVVASIFVNPLQFAPTEDLTRYPRREASDVAMLKDAGVALLWLPDSATMYSEGFATSVTVAELGDVLDGLSRPGHFGGVATVVTKLFNQIRPDVAVFGEKDWQQLTILRRMVDDLDLPVTVVGVQTQRDADGLALSSRNIYLTPEDRLAARALPRALGEAAAAIEADGNVHRATGNAVVALKRAGFAVDYVTCVDDALQALDTVTGEARILAAVRIGTTRLIDNLPIIRSP